MRTIRIPMTDKTAIVANDYKFIAMNKYWEWHAFLEEPSIEVSIQPHMHKMRWEWNTNFLMPLKVAYTPELSTLLDWKNSLMKIEDVIVEEEGAGRILKLLEKKRGG